MIFDKVLKNLDEVKVVSYFLSFAFISAGVNKILNFESFRIELLSFGKFYSLFMFPIILTEIWVGIGLIFRGSRGIAVLFGLIMLLVFTGFVLYRYLLGYRSNCGCGVLFFDLKFDLTHLLLNFTLIVLSFFVLINQKQKRGKEK
jgi:hypothetical protein